MGAATACAGTELSVRQELVIHRCFTVDDYFHQSKGKASGSSAPGMSFLMHHKNEKVCPGTNIIALFIEFIFSHA